MPLIRLLLRLHGYLARSWWLSRGLYRLHGLSLIGPPHEEVWYFAYGANMHDSAFRGWPSLVVRLLRGRMAPSAHLRP